MRNVHISKRLHVFRVYLKMSSICLNFPSSTYTKANSAPSSDTHTGDRVFTYHKNAITLGYPTMIAYPLCTSKLYFFKYRKLYVAFFLLETSAFKGQTSWCVYNVLRQHL